MWAEHRKETSLLQKLPHLIDQHIVSNRIVWPPARLRPADGVVDPASLNEIVRNRRKIGRIIPDKYDKILRNSKS